MIFTRPSAAISIGRPEHGTVSTVVSAVICAHGLLFQPSLGASHVLAGNAHPAAALGSLLTERLKNRQQDPTLPARAARARLRQGPKLIVVSVVARTIHQLEAGRQWGYERVVI